MCSSDLAPFHLVMLTLLLSVVFLCGVRCVRALTRGGAWLLAVQAGAGDRPDAADTLRIAIVDWKGLLIFAAVAPLTTVVVGFLLLLTPFG